MPKDEDIMCKLLAKLKAHQSVYLARRALSDCEFGDSGVMETQRLIDIAAYILYTSEEPGKMLLARFTDLNNAIIAHNALYPISTLLTRNLGNITDESVFDISGEDASGDFCR